jgi:Raf kinase inhibitor-like YbhB/YbcL family protein
MLRTLQTCLTTVFGALYLACAASTNLPDSPAGVVPESITVTSRSFSSGGAIPVDCTCDGKNTSPDVTWSSPPEGTQALIVILDDVEAPSGAGTQWVVTDIRPETRLLSAGADPATVGGKVLSNDRHEAAYRGPCPPHHEGHHYALRVIALDHPLGLAESAEREQVNAAMNGHVLGGGALIGTSFR